MKLTIDIEATDGAARTGTITSARGVLPTPLFMPVGTRASVKALDAADLEAMGIPLILANTYHLMLRPGADLVADLGGLHRFMDWGGHVLTDSGGYQIFSLEPKVTDEGATFRSTYDGSTHRLTPESAAQIQSKLGADIQMVLDVCPPLPSAPRVIKAAVDRTHAWGRRGRAAFLDGAGWRTDRGLDQAQFGIVQGGTDLTLRVESAQRTVETGFDGYAIGGLSVGEPREEMLPALAAALEHLPADQPRYLMGVGDPASIVEAVGLGVDLFDCVLPTRHARHGTVLTSQGRLYIKNLVHERDEGPLDPSCGCRVCARWSRAYLRHLHRLGEPTAARLLTIHNVAWLSDLVVGLRAAVREGRFDQARRAVLDVWG
ncbi:tRNA guanosine(34) transglycosylase Tgt [Aquihabitans sp. McL0605]|uniref:tRNA guanosine(34) transglycosylase Tgt n=1 Tax=Aquihabitans sp. McL0605 TaxID=3415671 RepID=UPI003CEE8AA7